VAPPNCNTAGPTVELVVPHPVSPRIIRMVKPHVADNFTDCFFIVCSFLLLFFVSQSHGDIHGTVRTGVRCDA